MATVKQIRAVATAGAREITDRKRVKVEVGERVTDGTDLITANLLKLAKVSGQSMDDTINNGDLFESYPLAYLKAEDFAEPGEFDLYIYTWSGTYGWELDINIDLKVDGDKVYTIYGENVLSKLLSDGEIWTEPRGERF